ncbi:MAG: FhaA domain-containing protein [Actinomycetota bacterium]
MGVAKSIEERLEALVEGFFTKAFRSGLQPVEVGRRILREMAAGKTVSVNRTYAPNEFRVSLGPDDHDRFKQMEAGLQREFSELVIEQAKEKRWNLMGLPRVTFDPDDSLGKGEFRVAASLTADPEPEGRPQGAAGARSTQGVGADLVLLDESGHQAETIELTRSPAVIGRLSSNDVVLVDPNVSRRHAELRRDGDRWWLVDLGSTNGSTVNEKLVKEHELHDGDELGFGTTKLVFKLRPGD